MKKVVLINGVSAKSAGGKSILTNLLKSIGSNLVDDNLYFIVIVPKYHNYEILSQANIKIIPYDDQHLSFLNQLYFYFIYIDRIIIKYEIKLIFNLADIIVPSKIKQLFLFDWAYAVYPESSVWKMMHRKEYFHRKLKIKLFENFLKYRPIIYAQTPIIKRRLKKLYNIDKIKIIPNAVSVDNLVSIANQDFNLPKDKFKFLCLAKYYAHKNLEIFLPLAKLIKLHKLPVCIIITIDEVNDQAAKKFINNIERENIGDIVLNIGEVKMDSVPSLYSQSDALILPTLLESFSGTYIEAMYHGKPIFTSDMDFARDVCGEAAIYFDPHDTNSVYEAVSKFADKNLLSEITQKGKEKLKEFPTWNEVSSRIIKEIKDNL